jgi:ABC-2 type transport system permease protein
MFRNAMLRNVGLKTIRDQRRSLAVWSASMALLVGMYAGFYPSFRDSNAYSDVVNQMPKALRDLFTAGIGVDFASGAGYVYMEMLSFMAPMLVLLYAIGAGAGAIAGEEERRTLDLLLSTPVSRTRLVLEKFAAMCAGVLVIVLAMGVALVVFGKAADMGLDTANVAAAMVHLALLGLVFGGLALATGAAVGRMTVARSVAGLVAVVGYLINGFAPSVSWLHPVQKISPFYQYIGADPIRHGLSLAAVGVAVATVSALVAAAVWLFDRRDVAT